MLRGGMQLCAVEEAGGDGGLGGLVAGRDRD